MVHLTRFRPKFRQHCNFASRFEDKILREGSLTSDLAGDDVEKVEGEQETDSLNAKGGDRGHGRDFQERKVDSNRRSWGRIRYWAQEVDLYPRH
jgi:hypothetical protein